MGQKPPGCPDPLRLSGHSGEFPATGVWGIEERPGNGIWRWFWAKEPHLNHGATEFTE